MLVSIIIPIYNVANYIEKCLLSALDQTYRNIEIILVNDCTPDNSMEVVNHLMIDHPRRDIVRIITHEKNKGLSGARNTGIDAAKGEYLYFLDSDDWVSNDCIELQAELAIKYNSDMVIGDIEVVGDARAFRPWWNFSQLSDFYQGNSNIQDIYFSGKLYMMAWNKLIRRSVIIDNDLSFKEGILHEDDLWMFKCVLNIECISILNKPTYFYLQREGSIMTTISDKSDESKFIVLKEMISLVELYPSNLAMSYLLNAIYSQICRRVFDGRYKNKLRSDLKTFRTYPFFKNKLIDLPPKDKILILPIYLPQPLLKNYYRVIGKLQSLRLKVRYLMS